MKKHNLYIFVGGEGSGNSDFANSVFCSVYENYNPYEDDIVSQLRMFRTDTIITTQPFYANLVIEEMMRLSDIYNIKVAFFYKKEYVL